MSIEDAWDMGKKFSAAVHHQDEVNRKQDQLLRAYASRCGNCFHWMKATCYPEKHLKQFKSADSLACHSFERSQRSSQDIHTYTQELGQLKSTFIHDADAPL